MRAKSILYAWCFMLSFLTSVLQAQQLNPSGICYVEVNNHNLLNVGSYTLENSNKQLFDVAIIFAANINYDVSKNRAYIASNNNVTKVLNDVETYVRPLQQKGIKVLLDILRNHQGAGICNFPNREAARDFAQQIAHTVYTYGLDGIDFDDEYAGYGNNATGQPNSSSFVMLPVLQKKVFDLYADTFSEFIIRYVVPYYPQILVIGGNIAKAYPLFKDRFLSNLEKENISLPVEISVIFEDAAILGAASHALKNGTLKNN